MVAAVFAFNIVNVDVVSAVVWGGPNGRGVVFVVRLLCFMLMIVGGVRDHCR